MAEVTYLKGTLEFVSRHYDSFGEKPGEAQYDPDHPIEKQTDKPEGKLVPCTGCQRALFVNAFYAPAQAKCTACKGQSATAGRGEAAIVQPGKTDPTKAANLADSLLNKAFAQATCPLCQEEMELKHVTHNPHYGPSHLLGYDGKGMPRYDNTTGETVLLQCNSCKTTTSYSTTAQAVYRRQNEPKPGTSRPIMGDMLGEREGAAA